MPAQVLGPTEGPSFGKRCLPLVELIVDLTMGVGMFILLYGHTELGLAWSLLPSLVLILGGMFSALFLSSVLQRGRWPVGIYRDGIEFHDLPLDRMAGKPGFVPASAVKAVTLRRTVRKRPGRPDEEQYELWIGAFRGKIYTTGPRSPQGILSAADHIRKERGVEAAEQTVTFERGGTRIDEGVPTRPGQGGKAPAAGRSCPSCGAGAKEDTFFCTHCGTGREVRPAVPGMPAAPACVHRRPRSGQKDKCRPAVSSLRA